MNRLFAAWLTLVLLPAPYPLSAQETPARDAPGRDIPSVVGDSVVSFVSDTQSPMFFEEIRVAPNHNNRAREMVYSALVADTPNAIFHLGDMVSIGLNAGAWRSTDAFLRRASDAHIPVFPTLGNHELIFSASYGMDQFYDRFPWYRKTGYAVRAGRLAVVLLNSNFSYLTESEKDYQATWLDSTLAAFEMDSTVGGVVLCCHHPPFTNSTIVSPSKEVRLSFVPLYLRYPKCRLFLSGHCHAFEHFREGGKDFLVIGGGGGLQAPLLTGMDRRWVDLCPLKTGTRMYHYLRCRITGDGLRVTVRMIKPDFSGFENEETISIPFASSPTPRSGG